MLGHFFFHLSILAIQIICVSSPLCLKPSFRPFAACRWKRPTSRLMDNFVIYLGSLDKNCPPIIMVQWKMDPSKRFPSQIWVMFYWTHQPHTTPPVATPCGCLIQGTLPIAVRLAAPNWQNCCKQKTPNHCTPSAMWFYGNIYFSG